MEIWLLVAIVVFILIMVYIFYYRLGIAWYTSREIKAIDAAELASLRGDLSGFEKEMIQVLNAEVGVKDEIERQIKSSATPESKKAALERIKPIAERILKHESIISVQQKKPSKEIIKLLEQLKKWVLWQERALRSLK